MLSKKDMDTLREAMLEVIEEREKNLELERLRKEKNEPRETAWLLMKRGLYENLIWFVLDTVIWIGLLVWLGVF